MTEYGGARFASYYFAEYLNVLVVSGVVTTVFLGGWLLPFGIDPPTWVDPFVVLAKMALRRLLLHLDPRDAAAPALRPAHELRLEDPAAAGDPQRPGDGDRRRVDRLTSPCPGTPPTTTSSRSCARPQPGGAGGAYRAFGETLRGLKTTFRRASSRARPPIQYPEEKVPGLPALPRPPPPAPLRGHGPGEVRRLLAVRRRLPGGLHPRGRGREHARAPRQRRRALRRRLRDQPLALHLLRLLRGRVPVRRDHDGQRLRDVRLRPPGPHLHQGDAAGRAVRAHAAARARASSVPAPRMAEVFFFIAAHRRHRAAPSGS